jgi:hypothetical protein
MKHRCQHLDNDGKRCGSHRTHLYSVYTDMEICEWGCSDWVVVSLCKKHAKEFDADYYPKKDKKKVTRG